MTMIHIANIVVAVAIVVAVEIWYRHEVRQLQRQQQILSRLHEQVQQMNSEGYGTGRRDFKLVQGGRN